MGFQRAFIGLAKLEDLAEFAS